MSWQIEYYSNSVQKQILALPKRLLARYGRLTKTMMEYGPNLGMPHTRSMGDKLFEIRIKGKEGIARAFYCTRVGDRIVILHVFVKKTQKTPIKELDIARRRLKEVLNDDA